MRLFLFTFRILMDFIEDLLVYPKEWNVLCTVRRKYLIGVLLLKSAVISFKVVLRDFFTSLESVHSPLIVTNMGFPVYVLTFRYF